MSAYMRAALATLVAFVLPVFSPARATALPQVMVIGVAHLIRKRDLHNSEWGSSIFAPAMQRRIERLVQALARYKPTKVMIEAPATDPIYVKRYQAYLRGAYRLSGDEDDQFGYRLAKMMRLKTIYPIDSTDDFTLHFRPVLAAAARLGQTSLVTQANAEVAVLLRHSNRLEQAGDLIATLRYLNTDAALRRNAAWYLYLDQVGNGSRNDAGQSLADTWYARNLQIFAYITRNLKPGDRAIVFIGQGHAALLRPMLDHALFLKNIDPESYLPTH